jgi:hypothetical protein
MKHRSLTHGRAWAGRARWLEAEDGRGGPRRDSHRRSFLPSYVEAPNRETSKHTNRETSKHTNRETSKHTNRERRV